MVGAGGLRDGLERTWWHRPASYSSQGGRMACWAFPGAESGDLLTELGWVGVEDAPALGRAAGSMEGPVGAAPRAPRKRLNLGRWDGRRGSGEAWRGGRPGALSLALDDVCGPAKGWAPAAAACGSPDGWAACCQRASICPSIRQVKLAVWESGWAACYDPGVGLGAWRWGGVSVAVCAGWQGWAAQGTRPRVHPGGAPQGVLSCWVHRPLEAGRGCVWGRQSQPQGSPGWLLGRCAACVVGSGGALRKEAPPFSRVDLNIDTLCAYLPGKG